MPINTLGLFDYLYCMGSEQQASLKMYRFEILTNAVEELGLSEATVFKCAFGASDDNAATEFVKQISDIWNNQNPLNSPEGVSYQLRFERFQADTN